MADKQKKVKTEELSQTAQTVVKRKQISGRRRIQVWKELLGELAHFDDLSDRLRTRATGWTIGLIILTVLLGIATGVTGALYSEGDIPGAVPVANRTQGTCRLRTRASKEKIMRSRRR